MSEEKGVAPKDLSGCDAKEVAIAIAQLLDARRSEDISVIDVREVLPITSYFVVASGSSSRALKMLGDAAEKLLRGSAFQKQGVETDDEGRWVCIDYSEVVVHLFDPDARGFYDLDRLWGDAPKVEFPKLDASQSDSAE